MTNVPRSIAGTSLVPDVEPMDIHLSPDILLKEYR